MFAEALRSDKWTENEELRLPNFRSEKEVKYLLWKGVKYLCKNLWRKDNSITKCCINDVKRKCIVRLQTHTHKVRKECNVPWSGQGDYLIFTLTGAK